MSTNPMSKSSVSQVNRRQFIATASAAALSMTILKPDLIGGTEANKKINIGFIGAGKRGNWIANYFQKHGGYNIVAAADYFQDRVDAFGDKFQVPASMRFTGLNGYRRLLEQKNVDAVVIKSPPYFHPEQAAAAVEAGKHVYLAKPIAVDVPGCLSVAESGKKAASKKLVYLVDFQTRSNPAYQEVVRRVQTGEIGKIISGESTYHCGATWDRMDPVLREKPNDPEARLRAWGLDRELSGDVITEQNIHVLDVASWFLDAAPLRAYGSGGSARGLMGTCWDHFAVVYYFPNDVIVSFNSKQLGLGHDDLLCRMYTNKGTVETHYAGKVSLRSDKPLFEGDTTGLYASGAVVNIGTFYDNVTRGVCDNPTVSPSVRSNLTTILGRTAAYKRKEVTWTEMMNAGEKFEFDPEGLKS